MNWLRRWLGIEQVEAAYDDLRAEMLRQAMVQLKIAMELDRLRREKKRADA